MWEAIQKKCNTDIENEARKLRASTIAISKLEKGAI